VKVQYLWRFVLTPDSVRQLSPRLRELTDSLESAKKHILIWGDGFRAIPEHTKPPDLVLGIAKLLGIPPRGFDESTNVAIDSTIGVWPAVDRKTMSQFVSLGGDLFAIVNRLIAAGYVGILPPNAKVPLPSEQVMAQLRDVSNRFDQLLQLININHDNPSSPSLPSSAADSPASVSIDSPSTETKADCPPLTEPTRSADASQPTTGAERGRLEGTENEPIDDQTLTRKLRERRAGMQAKLVEFMMSKTKATYEDISDYLYPSEQISDQRIRTLVNSVIRSAEDLNANSVYSQGQGHVYRIERPQTRKNS
jgi:hypothetical protein